MTFKHVMMFVLTLAIFHGAHALDNGLGLRPAMGYNTWYDLMGDITEDRCKETVDAFVAKGFPNFGYNYWNLDDLWSGGRNPNGTIYADPNKFPSKTLRPLADYVHSKGLLFGAYTDRGTKQCGPGPGSQGHEYQDAQTFADWQIDYLKEDACSASQDHAVAFAQYQKMRDGLNKTGRPIYFSLCGWNPWYAPPDPANNYSGGMATANSWRIGPDDTNWPGLITNININAPLYNYSGPGGWNDPCLLLSTDDRNNQRVSELQGRFQFTMWAIMASPLIISGNVRNMSDYVIETYQNSEVIAVNQDVLGLQGRRIVGGDMKANSGGSGNYGNGAPVYSVPCNSSDPLQIWAINSSKVPPGTFYLGAVGKALNAFDCGDKLVLWDWVTNGCDNNEGFYFHIKSGEFISSLAGNKCARDSGVGQPVTLTSCEQHLDKDASPWSVDADGLIHTDGGNCLSPRASVIPSGTNVWARQLSEGKTAIAFLNPTSTVTDVVCDASCLKEANVYGKNVVVRDLWAHSNTTVENINELAARALPADGGHRLFLLNPM